MVRSAGIMPKPRRARSLRSDRPKATGAVGATGGNLTIMRLRASAAGAAMGGVPDVEVGFRASVRR